MMLGVPKDGTTTGVGGYLVFIPTGVTVLNAAYLAPVDNVGDGITSRDRIPMKGRSPIAIGAGPVGAKIETEMIGLTLGAEHQRRQGRPSTPAASCAAPSPTSTRDTGTSSMLPQIPPGTPGPPPAATTRISARTTTP
ncbi:MAG: hypothetical protein IPO15_27390 [Anaerolineae bacterium]|uniref:hypothetical protein n=1 Tax=Candidatus Amarolinea dominans TaxID=3140696 RepID=UPI003135918B|nr:hypothetical protein [Anaerolineae bacterium]